MKTIIRKLLWSLSTVICLASSAHATDIKMVNWGVNVDHTTSGAQKQEFRDLVTATAPDFAFFAASASPTYFVSSDFGGYSVRTVSPASSNYKYVFFFYDNTRWSFVSEHTKTYTWARGVFVGEVVQDSMTGEQYALVFCLDSFKDTQSYSTTLPAIVNEMTNDCANARVLLSYNTPKITDVVEGGFAGAGCTLLAANDQGAVFSLGDDQPLSSESSVLSGTVYTTTQGFMATITYPSKYKVEFLDWDDTVLQSTVVDEHGSVTPPPDPEREGYEFTGWNHESTEFSDVTDNITAIAQYKLLDTNFMVTFVDWDNSTNEQVVVTKNTPVARPDDLIRPYYSFRAWMNGDEDWDFADVVASNLTLKADYTLDAVQNIANADELSAVLAAGLPDSVVIRLTNDISFAGTDYTAADFAGVLDGNGHYITGLPNNGKLFVTLSGTVHDLTVKDIGDGTTIAEYGGVFASKAMGASVYNCVLENANRSHNTSNVKCGGFFYESRAGEDGHKTVISNCVVRDCKIFTPYARDSQYVGGIAAVATDTDFIDCHLVATGADTVDIGGMATVAGGIVGNVGANSSVVRCSAEGIVEARRSVGFEWSGAGGIIGSVTAGIEISCCTNKARIVSVSGSGAGGIVGRVYASNPVIVKSSCNRGEIVQGEGSAAGRGNGVGGIVGGSYYNLTTCIIDCVNYGSVTAVDRAGGLIGCADSGGMTSTRLVVSNSFNYASVSAEHAAGGVVGRLYGSANSVIRNCGNAGAVSCPTNAAGGVVGLLNFYGNANKLNIDGMMQAGTVSTDSGFASLGVGILYGITWVSCSVEFTSAVFAGSASATGSGQVGSLCGGVFATENTKPFTVSADENCRLLGEYAAEYYDYTGTPQSLEISSMTAEDLVSKCGSVRILNDNASSKGYAPWVRAQDYPELAMFGTPWGTAAGAIIIFR